MSGDIFGSIEIRLRDSGAWMQAVSLDWVSRYPELQDLLFRTEDSFFGGRGWPEYCSRAVWEAQKGALSYSSPTYCQYSELDDIWTDSLEEIADHHTSDHWRILKQLADDLAHWFGETNVRFVVYFEY